MAFDILQGVQYDPRNDDRATQILLSGLNNANEQYGAVRSGLEQALGQYGSDIALNSRDADKSFLQQKLQEITANLPKLVQDKYAGDYGAARFDIARQIAKDKQTFDLAKAANQEEDKYAPIMNKLSMEKKLILPGGIDPRQQSIFNDKGQYIGTPQYNPLERSDYDKIIHEGLVQGIDKLSKEGKLHQSDVPGFMETITRKGLDALPNSELKDRIKDYTKQFLDQSTFMEDPEMAPYKDDPTKYLASRVRAMAGAGTATQYQDDWLMREHMREAKKTQAKISDIDQIEQQPATSNFPEVKKKVSDVMQETQHEKNLPLSGASLGYLFKAANVLIPGASKEEKQDVEKAGEDLMGKKSPKYSSPYIYAATEEGKKDMPGLIDVLGGVNGDNVELRKKPEETQQQWWNRVDKTYQNEISRVNNVSYTDAKIRDAGEQKLATQSLLGQGAGGKDPKKVIPNTDLDNYTYEVVDKNGKRTVYPASKFFDKYDKKDFVANANLDGYTFGDQGNMWKTPLEDDKKVYIRRTNSNQRSELLAPIQRLYAPKTSPGMKQAQEQIPFPAVNPDGSVGSKMRTVISGNIYAPSSQKYKFGMYVLGDDGRLVSDQNGTPIDVEDKVLNIASKSDPWIYGNRYGYKEKD